MVRLTLRGGKASTGLMASLLVAKLPRPGLRRLAACALALPLAVACAGADSDSRQSPSSGSSDSPAANGIVEPAGSTTVTPPSPPAATGEQTGEQETPASPTISPAVEPPAVSTAPDAPGAVETVPIPSTTMDTLFDDETTAGDTSDTQWLTPGQEGGLTPGSTGQTDAGTSNGTSTDEDVTAPVESITIDEAEGGVNSGCPHSGTVRYAFNNADTWPSDVVDRLTEAMDEAIFYYNCYSDLSHDLTVNFNESVPTAEANVDGWISFGSNRGYMVVATAMHEIGHTMGVGFSPWNELFNNGRWTGAAVSELMSTLPAAERDSDMYSQRDYITGDGQHFWPYGLNQAAEHQSEWSLINHVRIVAAMQQDKDTYRSGGR